MGGGVDTPAYKETKGMSVKVQRSFIALNSCWKFESDANTVSQLSFIVRDVCGLKIHVFPFALIFPALGLGKCVPKIRVS